MDNDQQNFHNNVRKLAEINAFELHKLVMQRMKDSKAKITRNDADVIRENHRFLWDEEEPEDWEQRLAKKYYSKLFREYCICDLSRYKENKVAMRWRIEQEVVTGKGQFICGNKRCDEKEELRSWEVNFTYVEQSEKKNALVKLRLCVDCSKKLNYHSTKRLVKKQKRLKSKVAKDRSDPPPGSSKNTKEVVEVNDSNPEDPSEVVEESTDPVNRQLMGNEWSKQVISEERSREEEFGDFLEDLLL